MTAACLLRSAHAVILCGSRYVEGCAGSVCQRLHRHRHQSNRCNKRCASGQHARHGEVQLPDPGLDLHEAHSRQRCGWHVLHGLATPNHTIAKHSDYTTRSTHVCAKARILWWNIRVVHLRFCFFVDNSMVSPFMPSHACMLTMQIARMLHSVRWVAEHVVDCMSARCVGPKGLIRLAAHYLYSIQFVGSHIDRYLLILKLEET